MSRTEAQIAASRLNGARSGGPVTVAGKAKSALNATKHGLWSREVVLSTEDPAAFAEFRQRLVAELAPATDAARELVDELAGTEWRLDRMLNLEIALLDREIERLRKEQLSDPETPQLTEIQLTAAAFQSLHANGVLRHVHRQEASLRRRRDKLTDELSAVATDVRDEPMHSRVSVGTNPRAELARLLALPPQMRRNEPEPRVPSPAAKRPKYDKDGRRIHYPDAQQQAA